MRSSLLAEAALVPLFPVPAPLFAQLLEREDNIWGWHDHQPTGAWVRQNEEAAAVAAALADASVAKAVTRAISIVVIAASVTAFAGIQSTQARQLPRQAIVHGQNLQPRENDLKSLGITDVSPLQAAEIDKLYRELLNCSRCGLPTNPSANG